MKIKATNSIEIRNRLFSRKKIFQIASKTFATQCFFNDHLNHKTVNKTVEHLQQILANYGHIS